MKKVRKNREVMGGQDVPLCFINTIIFSYFSENVNDCFPPKKFISVSCIDSVSSGFSASVSHVLVFHVGGFPQMSSHPWLLGHI